MDEHARARVAHTMPKPGLLYEYPDVQMYMPLESPEDAVQASLG